MTKAVAKREEAPAPAQVVSSGDAILSMIERAARDPAVDIVKLEKLMDIRERIRAQEAEAAYNSAMARAQARLKPVVKNAKNTHTKSKYATLDAIHASAMPIIHEEGFGTSCGQFKSDLPDHIGILIDVMHTGGHSRQYKFDVPIDGAGMKGAANKTATHAYGSTLSYGRRYGECMVFDIAIKDDDDGNAAGGKQPPELVTEQQADALGRLVKKTKEPAATMQIIFEHFRVESLNDLTVAQHDTIKKQLKERHGVE